MEPRPRAIRHDDPKGPGSVALAKVGERCDSA
jgi:hypothetical protein